jgi:uncharacterized membrane protein
MATVLDVLHVLSAVFLVGPMAILPHTALRSLRTGQGEQVTGLARTISLFSFLSLLVVFFGFGVLGTNQFAAGVSFSTPWIWVSLVLYGVALVLNLAVVVPSLQSAGSRLVQGEAAGGTGSAYRTVAMSSGLVTLLLLVVVILMVWKP